MKVTDLLTEDLIDLNLDADSKEEVITKLVAILDKAGKLDNRDDFYQAIKKREKASSTGVGRGVAVPHAKSEAVKTPSLVLARSEKGVDFNSRDEKPAYLFFMIAVPETESGDHLKILSSLSRKLMHDEFRNALEEAANKEEVIKVLEEAGEEKRVEIKTEEE